MGTENSNQLEILKKINKIQKYNKTNNNMNKIILICKNLRTEFGNGGDIYNRGLIEALKVISNQESITIINVIDDTKLMPILISDFGMEVLNLYVNKPSKLYRTSNLLKSQLLGRPKFLADFDLDEDSRAILNKYIENNLQSKSNQSGNVDKYTVIYNYFTTLALQKYFNIIDSNQIDSNQTSKHIFKQIYIAHNIESDLLLNETSSNPVKSLVIERNYKLLRNFELRLKGLNVICLTDRDLKFLQLSNAHTITKIAPLMKPKNILRTPEPKTALLTTNLEWKPNYDSIQWFINKVLPHINKDIKITITGKDKDRYLESINTNNAINKSNLLYAGFVTTDELTRLYSTASIVINPTISGSGFQIKMLEALAYGADVISTEFSNHTPDIVTRSSDNPIELANLINNFKPSKSDNTYSNFYSNNLQLLKQILQ